MRRNRVIRSGAILFLLLLLAACKPDAPEELSIYYAENAQFELISGDGVRVLIDVFDPNALTSPPTKDDILLTTHGHPDHLNAGFVSSFPGQQLFAQEGEIQAEGVSIRGIAATHTALEGDVPMPAGGSDYMYIIEMAGLRIAHFGDIGQEALTPAQLEALGEIDIALTQLVNSYSQMDLDNAKGYTMMTQLNPGLIVPTHGNGNMKAIGKAIELWEGYASSGKSLTLSSADLGETTKFVVMGSAAGSMQAIYDLPVWGEQ